MSTDEMTKMKRAQIEKKDCNWPETCSPCNSRVCFPDTRILDRTHPSVRMADMMMQIEDEFFSKRARTTWSCCMILCRSLCPSVIRFGLSSNPSEHKRQFVQKPRRDIHYFGLVVKSPLCIENHRGAKWTIFIFVRVSVQEAPVVGEDEVEHVLFLPHSVVTRGTYRRRLNKPSNQETALVGLDLCWVLNFETPIKTSRTSDIW